MILLLVLLLVGPAWAERYSYKNCINAMTFWCRHQREADGRTIDVANCVGINARQCAQCEILRHSRRTRGAQEGMGSCREWLDGTIIRSLRRVGR